MKRLLSLVLCLMVPRAVRADAAPKDMDDLLSDIPLVVTSTLREVKATNAPSTIHVVTGDQIRRWGIRRLIELVDRLVPGAMGTQDSDDIIFSFRGIASDNNVRVLMLINGHQHNMLWNNGANPAEVELSLMDDIDSVEVITGPGSAIYGSGATIGVINVITKNGSRAEDQGVSLQAAGGRGSFGLLDMNVGGKPNQDLRYHFAAGSNRAYGLKGDNGPNRINRFPFNQRTSVDIGHKGFELAARHTSASRSYPYTPGGPANGGKPYIWAQYDSVFVDAKQSVRASEEAELVFNLYGDAHQVQRHDFAQGTKLRGVGEYFLGAKVTVFYTGLSGNDIVVGAEARREEFGKDWEGDNFSFGTVVTSTGVFGLPVDPYTKRTITPYDRGAASLFLQDVISLNDRLSWLLGGRYDFIENLRPGAKQSAVTPRTALVYTPSYDSVVKLMYTTGFRQSQGTFASPDGFAFGGAYTGDQKKAEKVFSYELSGSKRFGPLDLGLNLFHNTFRNVSFFVSNNTGNTGRIDFQGGELVATAKASDKLFGRLIHQAVRLGSKKEDYALQHAFTTYDEKHIATYPEDVTKLILDVQPVKGFSLNGSANYVWESYALAGPVRRSGDYVRINANVSYKVTGAVQVVLSGYNLGNDLTRVPSPTHSGNFIVREAGADYQANVYVKF